MNLDADAAIEMNAGVSQSDSDVQREDTDSDYEIKRIFVLCSFSQLCRDTTTVWQPDHLQRSRRNQGRR